MSLLRHIRICNEWDVADFVPFEHESARIGWLRRANAAKLARFPKLFEVSRDQVRLVATGDHAALTKAIDDATKALVADGAIPKWRQEYFAVAPRWGAAPRFDLDRGAVPFFGVLAYGVHLNGWRCDGGKMKLWVGRRAKGKMIAPDKLDNLVAGGIGRNHGLEETLFKEAEEEASMPEELTARAVAVGAVSYRMATEDGVRNDILFLYDVETPPGFTPRNTDGEIVSFALMDADEIVERMRRTDDFKFNVNLVNIDFALRHGILPPGDPEYLDLVTGLHRPLD